MNCEPKSLLSINQRDIYIDQIMRPEGSHWNIGAAATIVGFLDLELINYSLNKIIRNSPALRTRIISHRGKPFQILVEHQDKKWDLVDFSESGADREKLAQQYIQNDFKKPFQLGEDNELAVFQLIKIEEQKYIWYGKFHHIITDGWGTSLFFRDVIRTYNSIKNGTYSPENDSEKIAKENDWKVIDYLQAESKYLNSSPWQKDRDYWTKRLHQFAPRIFPKIKKHQLQGVRRSIYIPRKKYDAIASWCQERGASVFHFMLASLSVYLSQKYARQDVVIGISLLNRGKKAFKEAIGLFASMIPFRLEIDEKENLTELVKKVGSRLKQDYRHQRFPLGEMKQVCGMQSKINEPLYDIIFSYEKHDYSESFWNSQTSCDPLYSEQQQIPLYVYVREFDRTRDVKIDFDYNLSYLDRETIEQMMSHFQNLFDRNLDLDGEKNILAFAPFEEQLRDREISKSLLSKTNTSECQTLVSAFEKAVSNYPENIALQFEDVTLTYAELNIRANRLARYLRSRGVGLETKVGLSLERSEKMAIAILAVLKAGGAYVPIDPHYPKSRLEFILQDSGISLLIAEESNIAELANQKIPTFTLESVKEEISQYSETNLSINIDRANAAYVIYTSGSTGTPKGCMVAHGNVMRLMSSTQTWYEFNQKDIWTLFHSFAFDVSVWEMWGALLYGGKLIIVPFLLSRSPEDFRKFLQANQVTVLNQTPSAFAGLMRVEETIAEKLPLRYIIFAGEALNLPSLKPWLEKYGDRAPRLIDMYGTTETTVHATYRPILSKDIKDNSNSIIGKTIPDLEIYLLDENLEPVADELPGEIYLGGAGVTRGYLNRPDLSAERFIPDPFSKKGGDRLYRTGDLARKLASGELEYIGRSDWQVKIRGFRIELGEIQAALTSHPLVREALITVYSHPGEDKRLVAYYLPQTPQPTASQLRLHLTSLLPDYMIPAAYTSLEAFPLTVHGKIDRKALPEPDWNLLRSQQEYIAPRNSNEAKLCAIVAEKLRKERVGIDDNFFEMGCDSILALEIVALANDEGMALEIRDIYEHPNVRQLIANQEELSLPSNSANQSSAFKLISSEDRQSLPADAEDAYPLSSLQGGMLYYSELHPDSAIYHDIFSFHLRLPHSEIAWRLALKDICQAHPILRTSFHWSGYSKPLQVVHQQAELPLTVYDCRFISGDLKAVVNQWVELEKNNHFDPSRPPLIRFALHLSNDNETILTLSFHHCILDGWSVASLVTELLQKYTCHLKNLPLPEFTPKDISYADFIDQEQTAIADESMRQFWQNYLSDLELNLLPRLPVTKTDNANKIETLETWLDSGLTNKLRLLAKSAGVPLKTVLLAIHLRVLAYITGKKEVVTGNVLNARLETKDSQKLLGLFVNTVPLRMILESGSWLDLIRSVFQAEHQILSHRQFSLLEMQRLVGKKSLFEVGFNYDHFHVYESILDSPEIEVLGFEYYEQTDFPLLVKFSLRPDISVLQFKLVYDVKQFSLPQIEQYSEYYRAAINNLAANPSELFASQSLMSPAEINNWKLAANNNSQNYKSEETIVSNFSKIARQYPEKIALTYQNKTLTYAELEERSNRLAAYLMGKGIGSEMLVGLCLERSETMAIAILAVLKAGGAYVPIDPRSPSERIDFICQDSGIALLLTQQETLDRVNIATTKKIVLEDIHSELENYSCQPLKEVKILPDNAAYVIYTSGSTGKPKGCVVTHANVIRLLESTKPQFGFNSEDTWTLFHSYAFDFSVWEMWGALLYGGKLVIVPYWTSRSPEEFWQLLQKEQVSVLNQTPSAFKQLLEVDRRRLQQLSSLRYVIFGGEALNLQSLKSWFDRYGDNSPRLVNMYGITETTVHVTYSAIDRQDLQENRGSIIGSPLSDLELYILDEDLEPVPVGVPGELYVGGGGISRGYLQKPDSIAQRFLPNPFAKIPGSRLYRSGDLARRLPDGKLEYIGRADQQVKIRGHRIELGEIEAAIVSHPQVKQASVTTSKKPNGDVGIVAYFSSENPEAVKLKLREFLQAKLADYAFPSLFVAIENIPLTVNGKVDRAALPQPNWHQTSLTYIPPRNDREAEICSLIAQTLHLEKVGVNRDFFEIGGDSITITQLVMSLREKYQIELPLSVAFSNRTPEQLARIIDRYKQQISLNSESISRVDRSKRLVKLNN